MKCLIVDDDSTSRLLLQRQLERYGPCHPAVNGVEAVEAVSAAFDRSEPYDLICLDIMMPLMDGQTALKEIRRIERERTGGLLTNARAKILMATAISDRRSILTAYNELADGRITRQHCK